MPSSLSPSKGNSAFYEVHMFAPSCRQKVTFRCGLVQKKKRVKERKNEDLAQRTASGVFQGFRSVSGTVHAVVKKRFYRGGPMSARPEGLPGSRGSFYVKSQIQVVFPPSLVKHPVPSRKDRGRLLEAIILFACHRHGSAAAANAEPGWKVSQRPMTRFNSTSEEEKDFQFSFFHFLSSGQTEL